MAVRATDVWRRLVRQELRDLLRPVLHDERRQVGTVRGARAIARSPVRIERMHEIDAELAGWWKSPLTGGPREQIVHGIADACALGLRWREVVEAAASAGRAGFQQAPALRDRLHRLLPAVEAALGTIASTDAESAMSAAARHALRTFGAVRTVLGLPPGPSLEPGFDNNGLLWKLGGGHGLRGALGARLLWPSSTSCR